MEHSDCGTVITTERLTIRRVRVSDWQRIKEIWEDQKRSAYACYDRPNDTTDTAVIERIRKWASFARSAEHMFFTVCLNGTMIGYAAFHPRTDGCELGYCFHPAYHGNGYARESLGALVEHIYVTYTVTRFRAGTAINNLPSVRLLRSLGFVQTGSESVSFYKDGSGEDIRFEGGIFEYLIEEDRIPPFSLTRC